MIDVVILTLGPLLTLAEAKAHLNVDHGDDDALIEAYSDAAALACLNRCDLKIVPPGAETVFKAAALITIGDLYANREAVVTGTSVSVSPTVNNLLFPYRVIRI